MAQLRWTVLLGDVDVDDALKMTEWYAGFPLEGGGQISDTRLPIRDPSDIHPTPIRHPSIMAGSYFLTLVTLAQACTVYLS